MADQQLVALCSVSIPHKPYPDDPEVIDRKTKEPATEVQTLVLAGSVINTTDPDGRVYVAPGGYVIHRLETDGSAEWREVPDGE